ncbi:MAG: hypothetical protein ACI9HY_003839 [Planctomycetaceae bacterium]|jgi:hypothetical protein
MAMAFESAGQLAKRVASKDISATELANWPD